MLTPKMSQALADAIEHDLDPWAYGSGVIAALKRRGFIARNEGSTSARHHATEAGAEAWREWCRASMVSTRNAAEA